LSIVTMSKRCIVTGGNQGLGLDTAKMLAALGWSVMISCRSADKGREAVAAIKSCCEHAADVSYGVMDLNDLASVAEFAASYTHATLELIVCNAGIMNTPFALSKDGIEAQYQSNHLGHFKLVHHVFPKLRAAGSARVISLSSRAQNMHKDAIDYSRLQNENADTYDGYHAYGRSKLSNVLMVKALAARFPLSRGVAFFALHPGLVNTGLLAKGAPHFLARAMTVEDGIKTTIMCATAPLAALGPSGSYYHNDRPNSDSDILCSGTQAEFDVNLVTPIAFDSSEADRCFSQSCKMLGIAESEFGQ